MHRRLHLALKGFLMGAADVIPGVSGGTVALIVGIYMDLVFCIRSMGVDLVRSVLKGTFWKKLVARVFSREPLRRVAEMPVGTDEERMDVHVEVLAFLATLFGGIVVAGLTMVKVLPRLLDLYPEAMSGFFFGLVLVSALIPFRMIRERAPSHGVIVLVAAAATFVIMGLNIDTSAMGRGTVRLTRADASAALELPATLRFTSVMGEREMKLATVARPTAPVIFAAGQKTVDVDVVATRAGVDTNIAAGTLDKIHPENDGISVAQISALSGGTDTASWYLFLSGAIAICAMILPGVSGSFLLLMLGQYGFVLHRVHAFVYARELSALPTLAIFISGIVVGILAFSRFLHWLLQRAHDTTMAALTGLMVGSLRKIWPFRTTDGVTEFNVLPEQVDATVLITIACFVVGMALVFGLNQMAKGRIEA